MAFHIGDPATDNAVRRLAKVKGKTLTETVREAVENEYERVYRTNEQPLWDRLKPLHDWVDAHSGPDRKAADKAFYDELSGDL